MSQLTLIQRTKIIEFWHQTKSVIQVQRRYRQFFKIAAPKYCRTIVKTVGKFSTMGTMCNVNKGHSGRRRSAHSVEYVDAVRESVLRSPRKSIRRLSAETSIPRSSVHRILRADLYLFPFKIQSRAN